MIALVAVFDKRVRAFSSFLAHVNVVTPPDPKSPSLADAIMGLKLGKKFKDLGAKEGRETIRALPMAVADLVQETFVAMVQTLPGFAYDRTGKFRAWLQQ